MQARVREEKINDLLTEAQFVEFGRVCRPVMRWLKKTCNPHVGVMIDYGFAELLQGICVTPIKSYRRKKKIRKEAQ